MMDLNYDFYLDVDSSDNSKPAKDDLDIDNLLAADVIGNGVEYISNDIYFDGENIDDINYADLSV